MRKKIAVIALALVLTACARIDESPDIVSEQSESFSDTDIVMQTAQTLQTIQNGQTSEIWADRTEDSTEETAEKAVSEKTTEEKAAEIVLQNSDESGIAEHICYADSAHVKVSGRTLYKDNIRYLGYSCSAAEFCFRGKYAEVELIPEPIEPTDGEASYYSVTVNSEEVLKEILTEKTVLTLVDRNTSEECRVKITKLSEGCFGAIGIGYIKTVSEGEIVHAADEGKMIEFIGDSLTCGYGVEASGATEKFSTLTENGLKAYAALTAERLGADYSIIGMNGIGIISRYTPHGEKNTNGFLMPELYRFTDGFRSDELWDGGYSPDICVIALGANDNSYTGGNAEREKEFSDGYIDFIGQVRNANPQAYIICVSGIQRSNLADTISASVDSYKDKTGDDRISFFRFASQKDSEGYGSDYHPSAVSQKRFSDELYGYIKELFPDF